MNSVSLTRKDGVSTITLNQPDRYNALNIEMIKQLAAALKEAEANHDRVLILKGRGEAFCAGGDVTMMGDITEETFQELMDALTDIALTIYLMPKIVIAAVHGSVAGLGLSLALATDYIIAQRETRFGMLFAGLALIPDGGGHFFLQERVGTHQAKHFIWSMEQIKGERAQALGIVDYLSEDVDEEAEQLVHKILTSPFKAIIQTKLILHHSKKDVLLSLLQKEKEGQQSAARTKDHKEGVQAFIEKRIPKFTGD